MRTKTHIAPVTRKHLELFDHRGSLILLYSSVAALSLALALTLEFGVGLSPATVLLAILPTSVLLLLGIPYLVANSLRQRVELRERHRGSNPAST